MQTQIIELRYRVAYRLITFGGILFILLFILVPIASMTSKLTYGALAFLIFVIVVAFVFIYSQGIGYFTGSPYITIDDNGITIHKGWKKPLLIQWSEIFRIYTQHIPKVGTYFMIVYGDGDECRFPAHAWKIPAIEIAEHLENYVNSKKKSIYTDFSDLNFLFN